MTGAERWFPIVGWEGLYDVSDQGNVWSHPRRRLKKQTLNHGGYPTTGLVLNGKPRSKLVHRLVMEAFVGPCPQGYEVNHIDGDKANCRLTNLEYVTPGDNQRHSYRTGLRERRYAGTHENKLTEQQVIEILQLRGKMRQEDAASLYGISKSMVYLIQSRRRWKLLLDSLAP
jgi:hypothetical protein